MQPPRTTWTRCLPPASGSLASARRRPKRSSEAEAKPAAVPRFRPYAPGSGLIEEEIIEEEEFDAPRHHHHAKGGDHDLDDFEEETLPTQIRSGDLGEMFQEAHLDHRIQLNFDDKNGDEEELDDEDEEEPSAEGQPAAGAPGQQRRDRSARGRRGRGGPGSAGRPGRRGGRGPSRRSMQMSDLPIISDLLKPGQEILVQIAKEPIAKKGARITSHIALPGRFLVFMPTVSHIGVSRKIASDEERQRLKRILVHERGEASGGFIVRTAAEGASEEELRTDLRFLLNLWADIKKRSDASKSPALIYHDLGAHRAHSARPGQQQLLHHLGRFRGRLRAHRPLPQPLLAIAGAPRQALHQGDSALRALRHSGRNLQGAALQGLAQVAAARSSSTRPKRWSPSTSTPANMSASRRGLRTPSSRPTSTRCRRSSARFGCATSAASSSSTSSTWTTARTATRSWPPWKKRSRSDRAPTKVLQFNDFGLVAITRKRVKQSLERTLSVPCPTCQATGMVKSPTTVCNEIYTELRKMKKHFEGADVLLRVNPETVKVLKANNGSWLTEFEELVGKNILVKSDATLHPEQFDIQG